MSTVEKTPDILRLSVWINREKDPEIYHFFKDVFEGNVSSTARMLMSIGANVLLMTPGVVSKEYGIDFGNMLPVTMPAGTYIKSSDSIQPKSKRTRTPSSASPKKAKPKETISAHAKLTAPKQDQSISFAVQQNKEASLSQSPIQHSDKHGPTEAQLLAAAKAFEALDSSF